MPDFSAGKLNIYDNAVPSAKSSAAAPSYNEYGAYAAGYLKEDLSIEYTTKDGDTVQIEYSREQYAEYSAYASVSGAENHESGNALSDIKQFMESAKEGILKAMASSQGGVWESIAKANGIDITGGTEETGDDYWSPENTSQRIVDFAMQFIDSFEGEDEEFFEIIKGAVKKGFDEARGMIGEMNEETDNKVNKTYELVMEKFDAIQKERAAGKDSVAAYAEEQAAQMAA